MILKRSEKYIYKETGVDAAKGICHRCGNSSRKLFYTYFSDFHQQEVVYCLKCVNLGRSDNITPLYAKFVKRMPEACDYTLDFELSPAQKDASDKMLEAVKSGQRLLLYAVTGAGKTEIMFEAIAWSRRSALNVAFVSPRIDVVKEVYLRLTDAFREARIDLMYSGIKVEFEHRFTVCTVHQLYNHIDHFDLIIVDETDAFPLQSDPLLMDSITRAAAERASIILMTATPSKQMIDFAGRENVVTLTRRYHGHDLAVPEVIWHRPAKEMRRRRLPKKLEVLIGNIMAAGRRVLIFLPEIELMQKLYPFVHEKFPASDSVYSGDPERNRKVDRMRNEEIQILLTTTILERGVTFSGLDVIVLGAEMFKSESLVQICGRVGRKVTDPAGNIWFMAEHNTGDIRKTIRIIKNFNRGRTSL